MLANEVAGIFVGKPSEIGGGGVVIGDERVEAGEDEDAGVVRAHEVCDLGFVSSEGVPSVDGISREGVRSLYSVQDAGADLDSC